MNIIKVEGRMIMAAWNKIKTLKNHPRVFMGGGMVLAGAGTVTACVATYNHIDKILDTTKDKMEAANESENPGKEKFKAVASCAGEIAKTYAPAVAMIGLGYAGIGYANHLHEVRESNLSEALTTVGAAYAAYRKRMEEKLGKEAEENIRLGATDVVETREETAANGKKKKTETVVKEIDQLTGLEASPFAKFFDASSRCWDDNAEYNMTFLRQMEFECNNQIKRDGYLFLSDVYKKLDIPITKASLVAGWIYDNPDICDNYVDFGLYDKSKWATRRFVNGYESDVLLDFNCISNISDYI